jgi:hypothetical protein
MKAGMSARYRPIASLLLCGVVGLLGCGGGKPASKEKLFPVNGVIKYKGEPVVGADVCFTSEEKNRSAFGRTDDQGRFKLSTFSTNDGAVEGKHVVTLKMAAATTAAAVPVADTFSADYQPPELNQSTDPKPDKSKLPEKYGDPKTSGIIAVIGADAPNEVNLDLD